MLLIHYFNNKIILGIQIIQILFQSFLKRDGLGRKNLNGITTPYLYIGGYGTTFGWHVEDLNLASINYNHYGAPKIWYTISRKDYKKFELFVKRLMPQEFLNCSEFLRHKTTVINPRYILDYTNNIKITKIIQQPGEFVITLNSSYHSGFNAGFNIAESVNFGTPDWLPDFPKFKRCNCQSRNVFIDPVIFYNNLKGKKIIRDNKYFKEFKKQIEKIKEKEKIKNSQETSDKRKKKISKGSRRMCRRMF